MARILAQSKPTPLFRAGQMACELFFGLAGAALIYADGMLMLIWIWGRNRPYQRIMACNASPATATAYFQLPPGRVVELGAQITL